MRLAYLVLAHEKPSQLARLVGALRAQDVSIFVHVDRAAQPDAFVQASQAVSDVEWVDDRVDVHWGGFGMVEASLKLMKLARMRGSFDYYILLSGADYPIASRSRIVSCMASADGAQFVELLKMPAPERNKPASRLDRWYFAPKNRQNPAARLLNRALLLGPPRDPCRVLDGMLPHAGAMWWCLTGNCVAHILDFVERRPEFARFFRHSRIPDEMFFHTIVANSIYGANVRPAQTYADWKRKGPPYPSILDSSDLPYLRSSGKLFARKFDLAHDPAVFDLIDRELRSD